MCGIAGLYHPAGIDPLRVRPMVDSLRHRGPDAGASFYWGPNQAGATHLGMGTRRLAIVDPTGGAQPIPCTRHQLFKRCPRQCETCCRKR